MHDLCTQRELQQAISVLEETEEADLIQLVSDKKDTGIYDVSYLEMLKSAFTAFGTAYRFEPGQIVKWKVNMQNRKLPNRTQPAVVVKILKKPIFDEENAASDPYFQEPLDLVLGVFDADGVFLTFYCDSRRFEPY